MPTVALNYNIILIGYRGTGKSTIGLALKERVLSRLISTDELIVEEFGLPIPLVIEKFGWQSFRHIESKIIKDLYSEKRLIIDCGGGVVENEENMKLLKEGGKVILLTATVDDIILRTQGDKNRPTLKDGLTLREEIEKMLCKRDNMYKKYSDFVADTSKVDMKTISGINAVRDEILDYLGENNEI